LGLCTSTPRGRNGVAAALFLATEGVDFADALHLSGSTHCEALYTFDDQRFARRARRLTGSTRVVAPTDKTLAE